VLRLGATTRNPHLGAGLRPGEAYALRETDVDLERRVLHVEQTLADSALGEKG